MNKQSLFEIIDKNIINKIKSENKNKKQK